MSALARAYKIEEIEENPALAAKATKECFACDQDNPLHVARATCKMCAGTGRQKLSAVGIACELKASKKMKVYGGDQGGSSEGGDGDLSLEY